MIINDTQGLKFNPDYVIHPGEYLSDIIESRSIKKIDLANRLNISDKSLSQIISGREVISSELSLRLERVLNISASIWNNLTANYKLFEARKEEKEFFLEKISWLKDFPIKFLQEIKILPSTKDKEVLFEELLRFLGLSSPASWDKLYENRLVKYKISYKYKNNEKTLACWLRLAELAAEKLELPQYSPSEFKSALKIIRNLTVAQPNVYLHDVKELCRKSGVALVYIPNFTHVLASGAAFWLPSQIPVIVISFLGKVNDRFWFTLFHEAGHILNDSKKSIFIDNDESCFDEENTADKFSSEYLINSDIFSSFLSQYFSCIQNAKVAIIEFARKQNIHPGIVVGRMQHCRAITYNMHHELKESLKDILISGKFYDI